MLRWFQGKAKIVSELVSGGAVLLGLIFVGLELRQNTAAVQAASFQSYTDDGISFMDHISQDADLAQILYAYTYGTRQLDDVEKYRARLVIRTQWYRFQNAYSQHKRGALADQDWNVAKKLMCVQPESVGGDTKSGARVRHETWSLHKPYLNEDFIDFIEGDECWGHSAAAND